MTLLMPRRRDDHRSLVSAIDRIIEPGRTVRAAVFGDYTVLVPRDGTPRRVLRHRPGFRSLTSGNVCDATQVRRRDVIHPAFLARISTARGAWRVSSKPTILDSSNRRSNSGCPSNSPVALAYSNTKHSTNCLRSRWCLLAPFLARSSARHDHRKPGSTAFSFSDFRGRPVFATLRRTVSQRNCFGLFVNQKSYGLFVNEKSLSLRDTL